ncbi:hypothetical protein [Methanogenium cariaci]|jgi:hypothetical protein|uniref:hypothetical protein n=1 Tax=Methanogenium cariaci TaxID=2197 RepID=UPI0012F6DFF1|nr:hypothetical protein [Methanogenium cariaci]
MTENISEYSSDSASILNLDEISKKVGYNDLNSVIPPEITDTVSNITTETAKISVDLFLDFAEMNPPKINKTHIIIADTIAERVCEIGEIDESFFTDYDYFAERARKFDHIIKAVNENFNTKYPRLEVTPEIHNQLQIYRKTSSFVPVIDSYNQLHIASQKLHSEVNDDYYDFYKNLFIFGADVAFTKENMAYKVAYRVTGILAIKTGLSHCTKVIGYQGYGLVLHSIHWKIRAECNETIEDLFSLLREEEIIKNTIGI